MTTDDIEAELIKLRRIELTDKEAAQAGADVLRCQVLQAIADGYEPVAAAFARKVLQTCDEDIGWEQPHHGQKVYA